MKRRSRWLIGLAVAVAGLALLGLGWVSRCFQDHRITSGSYMGMSIGADKYSTFEVVLGLYRSGAVGGFTGLDQHPGPSPRTYSLTSASAPDAADRMVLYDRWDLRASSNRPIGFLDFRDGLLSGVSLYDEAGYFSGMVEKWGAPGESRMLATGMTPQDARNVLSKYLASGSIAEVTWHEHSVAPPIRFDGSAYAALEPWETWQLFTKDWGGIWLKFQGGRLSEIHHRVQCMELP